MVLRIVWERNLIIIHYLFQNFLSTTIKYYQAAAELGNVQHRNGFYE